MICLTYGQKNAERKGFEPLEVVSLNGFQDRRNRPLCHLSESELLDVNSLIWGAKVLPLFVLCKFFARFLNLAMPTEVIFPLLSHLSQNDIVLTTDRNGIKCRCSEPDNPDDLAIGFE